jgi:hypothetical protein
MMLVLSALNYENSRKHFIFIKNNFLLRQLLGKLGDAKLKISPIWFLFVYVTVLSTLQLIATTSIPFNLFTAARTCYCPEQKIFTRHDDCAAL